MYRKTTKKQERKIKELETKIDNLTEYIMSLQQRNIINNNNKKIIRGCLDWKSNKKQQYKNLNRDKRTNQIQILNLLQNHKDVLSLLRPLMKRTFYLHQ
jgi:hypothetical protein